MGLLDGTNKPVLGPRSKVFKACEACRLRKLKCNGVMPCERCIQTSVQCHFRNKARRRDIGVARVASGQRTSLIPVQPATDHSVNDTSSLATVGREGDSRQLHTILNTLQISDSLSSRGTVTRVFGSTSSAAVLSLILDLIVQSNDCLPIDPGTKSQSQHHQDVLDYISQVVAISEISHHPLLNPSLPGPLDTVPLEMQFIFLDQYIHMAWKVLPFQSPTTLRAQLPHLLREPGVHMDPDGMALRSILFPMLSIGSITAGYADVGSMFVAEAQRHTLSADIVGDILVFQSDLLMHYIDSGCFTTAYMRLGAILPKILAAGMDKPVRTPQEQAIISAFSCHESFICFALGRETVFSNSLRYLPKSDETMVGLMQPFFSILSDIQKLHRPETVDLKELWNVSRSLDGRLQAFWGSENPHQGSQVNDEIDMGTVLLQYSILLLYRPFLILRATKRIARANTGLSDTETLEGSESDTIVDKACQYAIDAATESIRFFCRLFKTNAIQKSLPNNPFFLESACWALIIDSLWGDRASVHLPLIQDSIYCMEQMNFLPGVSARLSTTRNILQKARMEQISSEELFSTGIFTESETAWAYTFDNPSIHD